MSIRSVRGCPNSLSADPTPHGHHFWIFRGERVECDGHQKTCENGGCHAPIRPVEDFCSEECWDGWHAMHQPEALAAAQTARTGK